MSALVTWFARMKTAYINDRSVTLHSHPATKQDAWVIRMLHGKENGYFLECGACDGLRHSNTLALERDFRWTGLLVEADPDLSALARHNRPHCQHENRAVSVTTNSLVLFSKAGMWGGLMAFLPEKSRQEHYARSMLEIWVTTTTLFNLLMVRQSPAVIDYLSLDVEGAEVPILREFFRVGHVHYRFRCLTVGHQDAGDLMRLRRIMEPHGYELDHVQAWAACFINPELIEA